MKLQLGLGGGEMGVIEQRSCLSGGEEREEERPEESDVPIRVDEWQGMREALQSSATEMNSHLLNCTITGEGAKGKALCAVRAVKGNHVGLAVFYLSLSAS